MEFSNSRSKESSHICLKKPPTVKISHRIVKKSQTPNFSMNSSSRRSQTQISKISEKIQPIPSYLNKGPKKKTLKPIKTGNFLKNVELSNLREQLLIDSDFNNISTMTLNQLKGHLKEYSSYCALTRKYLDAKQSDQLYEKIQIEIQHRGIKKMDNSQKIENYNRKKDEEIDKQAKKLNDFDNETILKREQIQQKQKRDFEEFENFWKTEMPEKYRKASQNLLNLMTMEKKCAKIGEYDKAENLRKQVDYLIRIETQKAQLQLNSDYHEAKKTIIDQQKKELEIFEESRKHLKTLILSKHESELNNINKRETVLTHNSKQYIIDPDIIHPYITGNVSKINNDISFDLDIETILPPLNEPNDDSIIQKENKERLNKIEQAIKQKDEIINQKIMNSREIDKPKIRETQETNNFKIFETQQTKFKFIEQ